MKKLAFVLAVVLIAALAGAGQAADLQAGWYAQFSGASLYYEGSFFPIGTSFPLATGTYGPFEVTHPQYVYDWSVSVSNSVTGIASGTGVYAFPYTHNVEPIYRVTFAYTSNYDAGQMRLELVSVDFTGNVQSVLWSQSTSGLTGGIVDIGCSIPAHQMPGFRVIAVPEPTSLCILLPLLGGTAIVLRRRR